MMTLKEQIAQGVNIALEFKEARPKDALKFVKTVVAFANGRGGRLLFGVEDGTGVVKRNLRLGSSFVERNTAYSKVRNRGLAEALVYMHEVENWGGGVARYYARCRELGLREPVVEDGGNRFRVVFYRGAVVNRGANGVNRDANVVNVVNVVNRVVDVVNGSGVHPSTDDAVVDLIRNDSRITAAKMASSLGVVERTVQRALKALQIAGRIRRVGGTRGRWEVLA